MMSEEVGSEVPRKQDSKAEENNSKSAVSSGSSDELKRNAQSAENLTADETESVRVDSKEDNEVCHFLSSRLVSKSSAAFPVRRVSSFTYLRDVKGRMKSSAKHCKSEGNISSIELAPSLNGSKWPEFLCSNHTGQEHTSEYEVEGVEIQTISEEMASKCELTFTEPKRDKEEGNEVTADEQPQVTRGHVYQNFDFERVIDYEQRQRSQSDSTDLNSSGAFTAEKLRKTQSYTVFPHINKNSTCSDDEPSFNLYRTSCFRVMPHLSEGSFHNEYFPTISVLSRSSQFENYPLNMTCEISSESDDSVRELEVNNQTVLHTWRRPAQRTMSYSEPAPVEPEGRVRTWSLPDLEEKRSRGQETMHKVKASPSRLQFPEQSLKNLREERSLSSLGHTSEAVRSRSSSVMSLVDNYDSQICDQHFPSQEPLEAEEVMGHWVNRNRRQSISKQPSFLLVKEVDEENEAKDRKTPSAVSLVNEVAEQVLSSHEMSVSSESGNDDVSTVGAAVRMWRTKQSERRATIASDSPLNDIPKYASEIEQQAFSRIKQWKNSFALKLNNVLGERFQEMVAKKEEESSRKKKPKVLNVPMNLSDQEIGQLRNKILLELKQKTAGGGSHETLTDNDVLLPPTLPIPRVKFPRKASSDQNPADLRAQMMKELSHRVSSVLDDEEATHCYRPSSLVPVSTKNSLRAKHQNVDYIPHGTGYKLLDPDGIYDLLNWHETERKRLKAELEGLPQADLQGRQVVIDRDDANKVLHSMFKIMEDIFTGTIKRFMGSEESVVTVATSDNGGKANLSNTTGIGEQTQSTISETKKNEEPQETDDAKSDTEVETARLSEGRTHTSGESIFSQTGSIESLSSESSAELPSSESSMTGISFSSSSDAVGVCDDPNTNASRSYNNIAVSVNSNLVSASLSQEADRESNREHKRAADGLTTRGKTDGLTTHGKADESDKDQIVRIESIEFFLEHRQDDANEDMVARPGEELCDKFPTLHSSKNTTEPKELTGQTISPIAFDSNYQGQNRGFGETLENKTAVEDMLQQELETLENELNVVKERAIGGLLATSNSSEEASLRCTFKTESTDTTIEPLYLRKQNENSDEKVYQMKIQELQETLQRKTVYGEVLEEEIKCLKNDLSSVKSNSEYWFDQCAKKKEKIQELLINTQDVTSLNFELRREISQKSKVINERDEEIKRLIKSKTEAEILLREVKEKLSEAHKETQLLKLELAQMKEDKRSTAFQTDGKVLTKSDIPNDNLRTIYKEKTRSLVSNPGEQVIPSKVEYSTLHQGFMSSTSKDERQQSTVDREEIATNVRKAKSTFSAKDGNKGTQSSWLPTRAFLESNCPMTRDPEKTKKAVREWLNNIIREANNKLTREQKISNLESTDDNESKKYFDGGKKRASCSLRETIASFQEKISKDDSKLMEQHHETSSSRLGKKTRRLDRQEPFRTAEHATKEFFVSKRNLATEQHAIQQDEVTAVRKDSNLATHYSLDSCIEPFDSPFLTCFDVVDVSTADPIDSVEPFSEVFLPWLDYTDAEYRTNTEDLRRKVRREGQHSTHKAGLNKFFSSSDAKKTKPREFKIEQLIADEMDLLPSSNKETCSKGAQIERYCQQNTEERKKLLTHKTSVTTKKTDESTSKHERPDSIRYKPSGFEQFEKVNLESLYALQGSFGADSRADTLLVDETELNDSLGFLMGLYEVTPLSDEFNTVEKDIERLLVNLDAKTRSLVDSKREHSSALEKVLTLKLVESKVMVGNNNGLIDSISAEIKLNKEKFGNEIERGNISNVPQIHEEVETSVTYPVVEKGSRMTKKQRFVPEQHTRVELPHRTYEQDDESDEQNIEGRNGYGTEFVEEKTVDAEHWICNLFKGIGAVEKMNKLKTNGTEESENVTRKKVRQGQETDLKDFFPSWYLPESVEFLSSLNKRVIANEKRWRDGSHVAPNNCERRGNVHSGSDSTGTKKFTETIPFGHKRQQRKAERDFRLALWQEKNALLRDENGDPVNTNNIDGSLQGKIGEKFKRASRFREEETYKLSEGSKYPKRMTNFGEQERTSLEDEKQLDSLLDMYKSTQDVLQKQAEQEMAIKKCRNKVDCMTEEMKTLQKITAEDGTLKQGIKMVSGKTSWSI